MSLSDPSATIVALATPPGVGAIGVIRLSGTQAITITDTLFKGKRLENQPSHSAHFGKIIHPDGRVLDEVLVTIFKGPNTYTGEDISEISAHGSPYILQEIIQLCLEQGARMAEPGEFTMRAFLNGKMDLTQAEAVADLIASESAAAHDIAIRQLRGGFKNEIQQLRESLIHFASLVELELDFGEEDVEFANRDDLKKLVRDIQAHIHPLLQSFALGNALKTGVNTVIAGRPNAGKSTLLNALLNEERAIVSEIPGTTRDSIEEVLNIKGIQFRLMDTAGIRAAQDTIEAIGVARTIEKVREAALLVYVWDVSGDMNLADVWSDLKSLWHTDLKYVVVCNKMDRNPYFQTDWLLDPTLPDIHPYLQPPTFEQPTDITLSADQIVPMSAKNGQNLSFLSDKLYEMVVGTSFQSSSTIVSSARHHDALRRADGALQDVLQALETQVSGDFMAQDIRRSLTYLGEITGEIGVEDLLGNIFGKFCIGK